MKNNQSAPSNGKREKDLLVEKKDVFLKRHIYSAAIPVRITAGAVIGAMVLGLLAWLIAAGIWPIPYFGQFSASGDGVAIVVGVGTGAAIGGLIGGLIAFSKLKRDNG